MVGVVGVVGAPRIIRRLISSCLLEPLSPSWAQPCLRFCLRLSLIHPWCRHFCDMLAAFVQTNNLDEAFSSRGLFICLVLNSLFFSSARCTPCRHAICHLTPETITTAARHSATKFRPCCTKRFSFSTFELFSHLRQSTSLVSLLVRALNRHNSSHHQEAKGC